MDPSSVQSTPQIEEDEWDTDGFVIPSLTVGEFDLSKPDVQEVDFKPSSPKPSKEEDKIYLGPHGAPPSQVKQQELNLTGRKQRFKQKLKEADRKFTGTTGRENKVDNLRELVGSSKGSATMPKSSGRDWLDPHCHESQFERSYSR